MDYDNWAGKTRTFDRDDPSFWGGFPAIPSVTGGCSPLTKLKMTASSIQRDWYFTSLTLFCSIWRELYGGHWCIYKGNKSASQNMTKWLVNYGWFFFTSAFRHETEAICKKLLSGRNDNKFFHFHSFIEGIWSIHLLGSKQVKYIILLEVRK